MIDWLTFEVRCKHPEPIIGGRIMKADADGTVTESWALKRAVRGSYESSIQIKTSQVDADGNGSHLRIDGNPVKWFQGFNAWGTDDVKGLVRELLQALTPILGLTPSKEDLQAWHNGDCHISRVDLTHSFELRNRADVLAWLRASEFTAKTRHGRCAVKGGTNYWGKHSKRWALKAYSKANELEAKGHGLPPELLKSGITEWVQNKLRVELVLRGPEIEKLGLRSAKAWAAADTMAIYNEYLGRLQMSEQMRLTADQISELPARLIGVYRLWLEGNDLREIYPRRTLSRYRTELLKFGVDLSITQKKKGADMTNIIPLVRVLEAVPASTPDWAYGTPLLFEPRKA